MSDVLTYLNNMPKDTEINESSETLTRISSVIMDVHVDCRIERTVSWARQIMSLILKYVTFKRKLAVFFFSGVCYYKQFTETVK